MGDRARTRIAESADLPFLLVHDRHVAPAELSDVVARGRLLLVEETGEPTPVGWLRWGLFWDQVPFMNLLYVAEAHRGRGLGRLLVADWERLCGRAGHRMVLTSTLADENAHPFYRHLGYLDAGALQLPGEAPELLFRKPLAPGPDSPAEGGPMHDDVPI
jgi:GNAT superfamily N-acetyltransferase